MMVRELCEAYPGLSPVDIEDMTLDQIYVLSAEKSKLRGRQLVSGTPAQLAARGLIPQTPGGGSYVQRLRSQRAAERAARQRREKRQRREQRRQELIEYKLRQAEQQDGV